MKRRIASATERHKGSPLACSSRERSKNGSTVLDSWPQPRQQTSASDGGLCSLALSTQHDAALLEALSLILQEELVLCPLSPYLFGLLDVLLHEYKAPVVRTPHVRGPVGRGMLVPFLSHVLRIVSRP